VAADDAQVVTHAAGHFEPGVQSRLLRARRAFFVIGDAAAHVAIAQARHHVDGRAQAVDAAQARCPQIGLVAEHCE